PQNRVVQRSHRHILESPTSVNEVKAKGRFGKNNHRKISPRTPAARGAILCQPLQHLPLLDQNEPPLLLVVAGSGGAGSLKNPRLHLCRDLLRIELANIQLAHYDLVGIHLRLSVSMLESVPILKNSLDSKGFAIRET